VESLDAAVAIAFQDVLGVTVADLAQNMRIVSEVERAAVKEIVVAVSNVPGSAGDTQVSVLNVGDSYMAGGLVQCQPVEKTEQASE